MVPTNKIIWSKEQIEYLKKNYVETLMTRTKLRQKLNKRFKIKRTMGALNTALFINDIRKSRECRREIIVRNTQRGIRRRMRETNRFKKKMVEFMKKQSKIGQTSKEAWINSQAHFQTAITIGYFRKIAQDNKIKFLLPQTKQFINDLNPNIFNNKKLEEYMKSQADKERPFYEIESEIIEFFEVRLTTTQIKKYCILKGIGIKWN